MFDVAVWVTWPALFPEYIALVMRSCGVYAVAHATASTRDGCLVYRVFGVKLSL